MRNGRGVIERDVIVKDGHTADLPVPQTGHKEIEKKLIWNAA